MDGRSALKALGGARQLHFPAPGLRPGFPLGYHAFSLDRVEPAHAHLTWRRVVLLALARRKGFAVPSGFVVLGKTFGDLVRDTQLKLTLPAVEKRLIARSATMEQLSVEVRDLVKGVAVPKHIMLDIDSGCQALGLGNRALGKAVTIRACPVDDRLSSAPLERAVAVTRLSDIEGKLKACWASAFDASNLEAIRHFAIPFEDAAPSVLVAETVPCEVAGLLFSHAPGAPGSMLLEAVWGFHEALTEGKFQPSRYLVDRARPGEVAAQESDQTWEYAQGPQGAMVRRAVPADRAGKARLSRLQVEELHRAAVEIEKLVGGPVGVEWAVQGGVVFILQIVPLGEPSPPPSEADAAERYIAAVEAKEAAVSAPTPPPKVAPPKPSAPAPAPAPPRAPAPAPRVPPARPRAEVQLRPPSPPPASPPSAKALARPGGPARLLPVIETSLYVELPPGARAEEAAHIPHAGLTLDLGKWARAPTERAWVPAQLADAASAVFPRPILVELTDLPPAAYESMRERTVGRADLSEGDLRAVLGAAFAELEVVAKAGAQAGATNLHVIAPFIKSTHDARVLRRALGAVGLDGEGAPRTLLFSELRNPSTLLYNDEFAGDQDGIIVRASRFYKALLREGGEPQRGGGEVEGGAPLEPSAPLSETFVHALFEVTRAFERAGGTVLVLLEAPSDFETVWFYRELGVDGFIARLEDAEACARLLGDLEGKRPRTRARRRGI